MMIAVVASSGFSARLAAIAGPMRPWAQAVASAGDGHRRGGYKDDPDQIHAFSLPVG